MEITRREIIFSIAIISAMIICGLKMSEYIFDSQNDRKETYAKAVKIESTDLFEYALDTDVGNAFVYGELAAVDTVGYPELDGEYMCVKKIKERYTMHTRTYTTSDGKGHTQVHTETYWTRDEVDREIIKCKEIQFCGRVFPSSKVNVPEPEYLQTKKESGWIRYKYYGSKTKYTGTVYTEIKNGTIRDDSDFYEEQTIDQTLEVIAMKNKVARVIFWIIWSVLTAAIAYGFYTKENRWLEDR